MLTFLIVVTAIIITALATAHVSAKRAREAEDRARKERKKAHVALEAELLIKGPGEVWPNQAPDAALRSLRSLGNVGYLVWLLNCEPLYRDHRGQGEDQYPPDWEWRRGFVFLRDRHKCQGHRCSAASSLGPSLDCHHIKSISEFGPEEKGIHALGNLVTLCPICHASQHPSNPMLVGRATKSWSREQRWLPGSAGRRFTHAPKLSSPGRFDKPREIEVHSHPRGQPESSDTEPDGSEKGYRPENVTEVQVKAFPGPSKSPSQGSVGQNEQQAERHPGLQLEDLEKQLKETPSFKLLQRQLLELKINNLRNRIRAEHRVKELDQKADPERVNLPPLLERGEATRKTKSIKEGLAIVDERAKAADAGK